jgi:amidohydrolase
MDPLPIREANEVTYAPQVPGVMHACGHDAHVAMLLGAAQLLTRLQDDFPGEVRFFFQPEPGCTARASAPWRVESPGS